MVIQETRWTSWLKSMLVAGVEAVEELWVVKAYPLPVVKPLLHYPNPIRAKQLVERFPVSSAGHQLHEHPQPNSQLESPKAVPFLVAHRVLSARLIQA